jgi:hypothetical protein
VRTVQLSPSSSSRVPPMGRGPPRRQRATPYAAPPATATAGSASEPACIRLRYPLCPRPLAARADTSMASVSRASNGARGDHSEGGPTTIIDCGKRDL